MSHKLNPLGFILCVVQIRQNYLVFNVNSILFHRVTETKPLKGVKKCLLIRNLLISSGTRIYNIKCVNARQTSFNTCVFTIFFCDVQICTPALFLKLFSIFEHFNVNLLLTSFITDNSNLTYPCK
ncbi:Hypothetical_protein [Hexamita inflata]|uniref:Hypothetical_protein n=1 Tax=Hexamita inflata TaxID=28002 RepID=A0AA86PPL0_9EUKA|nr:Hypothetical protein HINF_LOCUS26319 [Hexamita inflata]